MDPQQTVSTPEASTTTVSPLQTGQPAQAPPAGVQVDPDADPESLAIEIERTGGREKVVPLGALREARERSWQLRDKVSTLEAAQQQVQQRLDAWAPIVQLVQQNPAVLSAVQGGQVPTRTEPTQEDRDAYEMAQTLALYDQNGHPDINAGRKVLAIADRRAQAAVQPVQQSAAMQAATANYNWAITQKDGQGRPMARPETIQRVFSQVTPELAADPRVAQILLKQARAEDFDYLVGLPQPPAHAPVFSEAPAGAQMPGNEPLSKAEEAAMKARGLSEQQWRERTASFGKPWEVR